MVQIVNEQKKYNTTKKRMTIKLNLAARKLNSKRYATCVNYHLKSTTPHFTLKATEIYFCK